jgi:hypothetical protein
MVKLEQLTEAPDVIDVLFNIRSVPDVPQVPVPTMVPPEVAMQKLAAVPVATAVPAVIAAAVITPELELPKAVALKVRVTNSVPVIAPPGDTG